jgi:hypothetical protein
MRHHINIDIDFITKAFVGVASPLLGVITSLQGLSGTVPFREFAREAVERAIWPDRRAGKLGLSSLKGNWGYEIERLGFHF